MSNVELYAVTGNPVLHSKSPPIFNSVFQASSYNAVYTRIAASSAEEALYLFSEIGFSGMSVTSPFKEEIMPHLDNIDEDATAIGSVNSVLKKDNKLYGHNTDHIGVTKSLADNNITISGKRCVVVGAGGAARAAVYALKKAGGDVTIVNRTYEKAEKAAKSLGINVEKIEHLESLLKQTNLLIYTVPSNLASFHDIIKEEWLNSEITVFDANYKNPFLTNSNLNIIDGRGWLINQAIPAYKLFTGKEPDEKIMRQAMEKTSYSKNNNITLIGAMGSGKTCVGKKLAAKVNFNFIDTDTEIEVEAKEKISDIFQTKGEKHFRDLERDAIKVVTNATKTIFSIGGGAVVEGENRSLLKESSIVVWLYCSPEESVSRMKANSDLGDRPLLNCDDPVERSSQILKERKRHYTEAADIIVNTSGKTIEEVAEKIYEEIDKTLDNFWKS